MAIKWNTVIIMVVHKTFDVSMRIYMDYGKGKL